MVLRYVLGRTDSPAVQAECFKMLAGGAQLIAIGMLAAAIVAPIFNSGLRPSVLAKMGGGASAAIVELIGRHLMGYGVLPVAAGRRTIMGELLTNLVIVGGPFVAVVWLGIYIETRWIGLPRLK